MSQWDNINSAYKKCKISSILTVQEVYPATWKSSTPYCLDRKLYYKKNCYDFLHLLTRNIFFPVAVRSIMPLQTTSLSSMWRTSSGTPQMLWSAALKSKLIFAHAPFSNLRELPWQMRIITAPGSSRKKIKVPLDCCAPILIKGTEALTRLCFLTNLWETA